MEWYGILAVVAFIVWFVWLCYKLLTGRGSGE